MPEKFPFILLGNKADREEEREVEVSAVQEFLSANPTIKHFNTSAKKKEGVNNAFEQIALASLENRTEAM
jgi:GTPase SAR1 family protein